MPDFATLIRLHPISWIKSVWYEVKPEPIRKCFAHYGCLPADGRCSVDTSEGNDRESNLTNLCEIANVKVNLSSVDKHIESFKGDENCDMITAELNPNMRVTMKKTKMKI